MIARNGDDALALDAQAFYGGRYRADPGPRPPPSSTPTAALYRPGQELRWKAVAYEGSGAKLRVDDDTELTIELLDANGQQVASQAVTTNHFGSASGTFTVPAGRLLGAVAALVAQRPDAGAGRGVQAAHLRGDAAQGAEGGAAPQPRRQAAEDGKEYFFHRGGLQAPLDFDSLNGGEKVAFEVEQSPKGPRATQVSAA